MGGTLLCVRVKKENHYLQSLRGHELTNGFCIECMFCMLFLCFVLVIHSHHYYMKRSRCMAVGSFVKKVFIYYFLFCICLITEILHILNNYLYYPILVFYQENN